MAKTIWVNQNGFKFGRSKFGLYGENTGTVKQIVHDGDTVNVRTDSNFGIRFLGIDTPEISFQLPDENGFTYLKNDKWKDFFNTGNWQINLNVSSGLLNYLQNIIGTGDEIALNHYYNADLAQKNLENILTNDLNTSNLPKENFEFFMAFSNEFLDTYGRFLCYLHSSTENYTEIEDKNRVKELCYNEQQLKDGFALPYFIWPNIQPFIKIKPFEKENVEPDKFWQLITQAPKLKRARQFVLEARNENKGIYGLENSLKIAPFELRFLARKLKPERYVIDLSKTGQNGIYIPENYYLIPNAEDRLFIPKEFIPIFLMYGWEIIN